jgi:hypothetical protein
MKKSRSTIRRRKHADCLQLCFLDEAATLIRKAEASDPARPGCRVTAERLIREAVASRKAKGAIA